MSLLRQAVWPEAGCWAGLDLGTKELEGGSLWSHLLRTDAWVEGLRSMAVRAPGPKESQVWSPSSASSGDSPRPAGRSDSGSY